MSPVVNTTIALISVSLTILICAGQAAAQEAPADGALQQYREQRTEAANRARRIIFNNDGDDHLLSGETSVEAFLAKRTTPLVGSQVDTIFYCTSRPFGMFLHRTKFGDTLTATSGFGAGRTNVVADFIEQGTDPLQVMIDYCRKQNLEVFWSMRMNDTHDASHSSTTPHPYWCTFKQEHPECLFGTRSKPPAFGSWSAVDYACEPVRETLFQVFQEICQNYDVDGIELDFYRHLVLFRSVANGGTVTPDEVEMMNELLRRVRKMTEEEGMRRGKPILISMRVPDSVEYCLGMGLDIEKWMDEGLVDILVAGGDFRLNPWEYSTALGEKHNVPVYCDLDPSIPYKLGNSFDRNSIQAYRARAMNAWEAGGKGIYIFNLFSPNHEVWWELGDPEKLRRMDKLYFVNVMGSSGYLYAGRCLPGGQEYSNLPRLHPLTPLRLTSGGAVTTSLTVGEDIASAADEGLKADVTCHVIAGLPNPPEVTLNGVALTCAKTDGTTFSYPVSPETVRRGDNEVSVSMPREPRQAGEWDIEYECDESPPTPWSRRHPGGALEAKMQDGALLIADRSTETGSYLYYSCPLNADPSVGAVIEARVKVVAGRSTLILADGTSEEEIRLHPDRVEAFHGGIQYAMDTTSEFHLYRVELKGNDIKVFVDGELVIDGPGKFAQPAYSGRNLASFGASSSATTGEAYWELVRLRSGGASLYDIVLSVNYSGAGTASD